MSGTAKRSEQFAPLVERHPDNELFRFSLAQSLVAESNPTAAIEHFEFCVHKKKDWMMPRILLGKALIDAGRRSEAKTQFEEALQLAIEQSHEDPERELRQLLADLG